MNHFAICPVAVCAKCRLALGKFRQTGAHLGNRALLRGEQWGITMTVLELTAVAKLPRAKRESSFHLAAMRAMARMSEAQFSVLQDGLYALGLGTLAFEVERLLLESRTR